MVADGSRGKHWRTPLSAELRWAWRGVRSRGWRAVFIVLLFGVALAANAVVFSAADAFVFRTVPYHQPERLAIVEKVGRGPSDYIWPAALKEWRNHRDVFDGIHGHSRDASAYLTSQGITETVRTERVTPGLFELLGVVPVWGRPFTAHDTDAGAPLVAVIGNALARRLFGSPADAVGQTFFTGRETLTIIGVMPAAFRFPTAREEIWRPLDLSTWPDNSGVRNIARLTRGQTIETAARAVASRTGAVEQLVSKPIRAESMRLRSLGEVRGNSGATTVFAMLVGAATCLLLIACANVASLEMAAAARRVRIYAVQTALGASRGSLLRVGLLEGVVLLGVSAVVASVLTFWGISLLDRQLTVAMRDALTNPLDVDLRAVVFMLAVAALTFILTTLPAVWRISRTSIVDGLRDDPRVMPVTRSAARSRQWLMAGQVALTTLLLVAALLYIRTYAAKVGLDKGFDVSNIATIEVFPAPDATRRGTDLEAEILARLRSTPGIRSVARTTSLPPSTQSGITANLTIVGRDDSPGRPMLHFADVDPEYFTTMEIPIVQGRAFEASSPREHLVVDERFARTYWPGGAALGSRFRMQGAGIGGVTEFEIVGISRQLRADRLLTASGDDVFVAYIRPSPDYFPLTFVARLDDDRRLEGLGGIVRSIAARSMVRVDTVAARYARLDGDTRLAAAITGGFGLIALVVATSGVYAVMAFLVAGRAREIAIRMALGADRAGVRRLVFGTSLRYVLVGAAAGLVSAGLAAQAIAAQLYGVTATDPATYAMVSSLVIGVAALSTWWPARRAAQVDPAVTLRSE